MDDLGYRLLQHLTGEEGSADTTATDEGFMLIARSMGPAELLDYDHRRLCGLVVEEGSYNSHVAILARTLDIPVVGGIHYVLSQVEEDAPVLVDGNAGVVVIRPGAEFQARFRESIDTQERRRVKQEAIRGLPAQTRDGVDVSLLINAGLLIDLDHLADTGADGVGLLRTKIAFMLHSDFPSLSEQRETYAGIFDAAGDQPVVLWTFDIGGDEMLISAMLRMRNRRWVGGRCASPRHVVRAIARLDRGCVRPRIADYVSHGERSRRVR